jgi:cytochrome c peroxidase
LWNRRSTVWRRPGCTIAQFKTPVLRDLVDSQPHFHNGAAFDLDAVVDQSSRCLRSRVRGPCAIRRQSMSISASDRDALVAFLMSLTEDYEDA